MSEEVSVGDGFIDDEAMKGHSFFFDWEGTTFL